jgi:Nif-specific regulatory protein
VESGHRLDRDSPLLVLSRAFAAKLDLEELLSLVLTRTKEVLQAEGASVLLLDDEKPVLFFLVTSSVSSGVDQQLKTVRFPATMGIAGWVGREGRGVLVPDASQDERFYPEVDRQTGMQTRDLICTPLRTRGGVIGVVEIVNRRDGSFTEEDLEFLSALSISIAIAIENARLYQKLAESESRLKQEVSVLHRERVHRERFQEILGNGPAMEQVFSLMKSAVPSAISVLLEGESGVGKELIARAIHYRGPRKHAPFVSMNCGAVADELLERELFGFRRGSFPEAAADKPGLLESAHGGTIFLDEIAELSLAVQVKLLHALQEGESCRIGETLPRKVDVRVISATNRDLEEEIEGGRFREDLYYRISVFPIRLPPLRERREDIPRLASRFLSESCKRLGKHVREVAPEALDALARYRWPGNVRELENEIERATALAVEGAAITTDCLSERVLSDPTVSVAVPVETESLKQARDDFERQYITEVLRHHQGNATRASRALGMSRQMLQRKIKAYGLRARG